MKTKEKSYFTVTGMYAFPAMHFVEPGMEVTLEKEKDNEYDSEAILVKMEGIGKIGYVANSVKTVVGETKSAGRIYDLFEDTTTGTVMYNMEHALVCVLD